MVVVSVYRTIYRPFTISSLSSQLLERRKLYWGSISLHYGIILILLGHLLALVLPKGLLLWNAVPIRLYTLETINQRHLHHDGMTLCHACAGLAYYAVPELDFFLLVLRM